MDRVREIEAQRLKYVMELHNKEIENQEEVDLGNGEFRIDFQEMVVKPNKLFTIEDDEN